MQRVMMRVDGAIGRRRRVFLAAWLVLVIAAVPFAVRQSDHLTGGGFTVPGSQAENVRTAMDHAFRGGERAALGVVLVPVHAGAGAAPSLERSLRSAIGTVERRTGDRLP